MDQTSSSGPHRIVMVGLGPAIHVFGWPVFAGHDDGVTALVSMCMLGNTLTFPCAGGG